MKSNETLKTYRGLDGGKIDTNVTNVIADDSIAIIKEYTVMDSVDLVTTVMGNNVKMRLSDMVLLFESFDYPTRWDSLGGFFLNVGILGDFVPPIHGSIDGTSDILLVQVIESDDFAGIDLSDVGTGIIDRAEIHLLQELIEWNIFNIGMAMGLVRVIAEYMNGGLRRPINSCLSGLL